MIQRTQVVKKKWKISTKTNKDGFSPAVYMFRSRLEQKIPVTESLARCVFVLFSTAKTILRMGSCVRFCCHNILLPSHHVRRRLPSVSALEFRCCGNPLVNQRLTFGEKSAVSRGKMIFHRELVGCFHCKLFLSSEIAKTVYSDVIQVNLK